MLGYVVKILMLGVAFPASWAHAHEAGNFWNPRPTQKQFRESRDIDCKTLPPDMLGNVVCHCWAAVSAKPIFTVSGEKKCHEFLGEFEKAKKAGYRVAFAGSSDKPRSLGGVRVWTDDAFPSAGAASAGLDARLTELSDRLRACEQRLRVYEGASDAPKTPHK